MRLKKQKQILWRLPSWKGRLQSQKGRFWSRKGSLRKGRPHIFLQLSDDGDVPIRRMRKTQLCNRAVAVPEKLQIESYILERMEKAVYYEKDRKLRPRKDGKVVYYEKADCAIQ